MRASPLRWLLAAVATLAAAALLVPHPDARSAPDDGPLRIDQVVPLAVQPHAGDPDVIWYDPFDSGSKTYAEDGLPRVDGERLGDAGGSREMRYREGEIGAGGLKLFFGDSPTYRGHVVRGDETFDDVYWRVYVKHAADWQGGGPAKLSRATSLVPPGWRQSMIAHVWSSGESLTLDPASGVRGGEVVTRKYNDFEKLRWLGNKPVSPLRVHSAAEAGRWVSIESRARLNTPGRSDGLNQLWMDGVLQCERRDLDWRGTYADRGINAVFLEGYWNAGSPVDQSRWLDDFVVSTRPIGPVVCPRLPEIRLRPHGSEGVVVEIARLGDLDDERVVVWRSAPLPDGAVAVQVGTETGTFTGDVPDGPLPADTVFQVRVGRSKRRGSESALWSPWHQAFRTGS